jgi:hypothetical protein
VPLVNNTIPESPVPGDVTAAVAPVGIPATLAVNDAVEVVRVTVIAIPGATLENAAVVELAS